MKEKVLGIIGLLIVTIFGFATLSQASNWYVVPGGAGGKTGVDWNNAWDIGSIGWLKSSTQPGVQPGDTIWLAGGAYTSSLAFGQSGTSGNPITVKRVLASDPVPTAAAGWSPSFDSLVIIPGTVSFSGGPNYTILDGRIEYGIRVTFGNGGVGIQIVPGNSSTSSMGVIVQYVESVGPGLTTSEADAFSAWPLATLSNLLISHCWFHNTDTLIKRQSWVNGIVQYTKLTDTTYQSGGPHPDIVYSYPCSGSIFRYNFINNSAGDGVFYSYGGSTNEYWYGNLFLNWAQYIFSLRTTTDTNGAAYGTFYLWNNVFADYSGGAYDGAISIGGTMSADSSMLNNIFDVSASGDSNSGGGFPQGTNDYNYYVTGTSNGGGAHSVSGPRPFVSSTDFHLTSALPEGENLGVSPAGQSYNIDAGGNPRPPTGSWDVGAYQFQPYGDVADTGHVTAYDSALVAQYAVGVGTNTFTPWQQTLAKVSGDAQPTIYDAALIAQYAVGLIKTFPAQNQS